MMKKQVWKQTDKCIFLRNCQVFITIHKMFLLVSAHFSVAFLFDSIQKILLFDLECFARCSANLVLFDSLNLCCIHLWILMPGYWTSTKKPEVNLSSVFAWIAPI